MFKCYFFKIKVKKNWFLSSSCGKCGKITVLQWFIPAWHQCYTVICGPLITFNQFRWPWKQKTLSLYDWRRTDNTKSYLMLNKIKYSLLNYSNTLIWWSEVLKKTFEAFAPQSWNLNLVFVMWTFNTIKYNYGFTVVNLQVCLTVHTWREGAVGEGLHVIGGAVESCRAGAGQQLQHLCPLRGASQQPPAALTQSLKEFWGD